jgi:hypothetical protein
LIRVLSGGQLHYLRMRGGCDKRPAQDAAHGLSLWEFSNKTETSFMEVVKFYEKGNASCNVRTRRWGLGNGAELVIAS